MLSTADLGTSPGNSALSNHTWKWSHATGRGGTCAGAEWWSVVVNQEWRECGAARKGTLKDGSSSAFFSTTLREM